MTSRATWLVVAVGALGITAFGCGSKSGATRHLSAQLNVTHTSTATASKLSTMRAVDVIRAQLRTRAAMRARTSPLFAKNLASKLTRLGSRGGKSDRLRVAAKTGGTRPLDDAFAADVAVFAYDDQSDTWLDSQYVDPTTGYYDLGVPDDSPVSLWVGTYDGTNATIVAPMTYGFDYELPPSPDDVSWDYDPYFYADPGQFATDSYLASADDQSGYYQIDYVMDDGTQGQAWFYLLPDDPSLGSYYFIWDDGTCSQGVQLYVAFDATGTYWSVNGVDASMSMSGTSADGYLDGDGRWTMVGWDGMTYYATMTLTYLSAPPTDVCPADALVVPPDPTAYVDGCTDCCPVGCSVDASFGICTIDGTLDPTTGVGVSCDLVDTTAVLTNCPAGCAELVPSDGFCYVGGDPAGDICY